MDFWDLTKLMFRRWYISVSLLLIAIAGTAYTAVAVKPDYSITSYVQLIPPTAVSDPVKAAQAQNPWLALGITSLSNAAMVATQDQTFLDVLKVQDDSASFEITIGDRNPVAIIAVIAPTLEQAESATALITKHYAESVGMLQKQYGVKAADMITAYRLDKGENVTRPGGKVKRAVVVVFAVGILMTGGVTILADALIRRRRRPRASSAAASPSPADDPPAPPPVEPADSAPPPARPKSNGVKAAGADWEKTRPVGTYGQRRNGTDDRSGTDVGAETVRISLLSPEATIALPRMRQPGDPGSGDERGRRT